MPPHRCPKRVGSHRTATPDIGELDSAVRAAIAQSRSREQLPGLLHFSADDTPSPRGGNRYWDPRIAALKSKKVAALFAPWLSRGTTVQFEWSKGHVAVFNSRGIRRSASVTAANIETLVSRRPGGGRAAAAARFLDDLKPNEVVERAHELHVSGDAAELPNIPLNLVLSPEATSELIDILNRVAFSAISYYQGSSFLREHLDVQVFDRSLNLRDDADDPTGLPFPFDLEGSPKRPIDLIFKGSPKTPALDQRQAAQLGLTPTSHAIGGNDARALNLFLDAGEKDASELLDTVDEGVWIGWLDQVECFEPSRVQIRGHARGVRQIRGGKLTAGLPDLIWEDSLLRAFSNLLGIGSSPVQRLSHDGLLGGISTPSLAFSGVTNLQVEK